MDTKEFMIFVEEQHKRRIDILGNLKKKRTADTDNRLINFIRMAAIRMCSVESASADLASKQFIDFIDMASKKHPNHDDLDYFKELGADIQNYVDLTLAIAEDVQREGKADKIADDGECGHEDRTWFIKGKSCPKCG